MNELEEFKPQEINFLINSEEDLVRLNLVLKKCIEANKKIDEKLKPRIEKAYASHKDLVALSKETKKPWEDVIEKIKTSLKLWHIKKEAEAKALQDKINADLAKSVEEQKAKLLSEATDEWSKEIAQDKVAEIVTQTVELSECKKAVEVKQDGQYKRSNFKCRVIDFDLVPREYLILNETLVNKLAREQKENFNIAGLEVFDDFSIVTKI